MTFWGGNTADDVYSARGKIVTYGYESIATHKLKRRDDEAGI